MVSAAKQAQITCPICRKAWLAKADSWDTDLAQHLCSVHGNDAVVYNVANTVKPWKCPGLCGRVNTFKTAHSLCAHIKATHSAVVAGSTAATFPTNDSLPGVQPGCVCFGPGLPLRQQNEVVLATWNLERFSLNAEDTRLNGEKIANMCATLQHVAANRDVIVALQEVSMVPAVKFFADYLTEKTGRRWMHAVSARPLGQARFAEYGAFLWTDAPHIHADPVTSFATLCEDDYKACILAVAADGGEEGGKAAFLRSPFFGLFRVGAASLLLVNVHLAATERLAKREVGLLHRLTHGLRGANRKLFHRYSLFGRLRSERARGACAVLGDFNLPLSGPLGRNGAAAQAREEAWEAFRSRGWSHLLDAATPTNWRVAETSLKHLDDIWLPNEFLPLKKAASVERPPAHGQFRDRAYPNHLLCWALLDLASLQKGAVGWRGQVPKRRPLVAPALAGVLAAEVQAVSKQ